MRKISAAIMLLATTLALTSCIPSGNIVGRANFTTIDASSDFASVGDVATVDLNGAITATPQGLRVRITRANFSVGSFSINVPKSTELLPGPGIPKELFKYSRLKGKNSCGWMAGSTSEGIPFVVGLFNSGAYPDNPIDAQLLIISIPGYYWIGTAPANSLKIGGRNLCGNWGF